MRIDRFARQLVLPACCLALLALPSAAFADAEPNDGITQTEEPLAGGQVYSGTLFSDNDQDWYAFNVTSQTQLDIAVTEPGDSPCDVTLTLRDADGGYIQDVRPDQNTTLHILYTTPAETRRFLLVADDSCAGSKYQFRLDPAASIVDGPRRGGVTPTGEPNENPFQAGQMAGSQQYSASIDTENDEDWFYFYSGRGQFDVAVTATAGCHPTLELYEEGQENEVGSAAPNVNETEHVRLTPPGPRRYFLRFTGCIGAKYQFRADGVYGAPQQEQQQQQQEQPTQLPYLTTTSGYRFINQSLSERYGSAFTRKRNFRRSCSRRSDQSIRCSVSWIYKRWRYRGTVSVYYFWETSEVYIGARWNIKRHRR